MDFNDRRPNLGAHVDVARKAAKALTKLSGGTGATTAARARHEADIKTSHEALVAAGRKDISGALVEEQHVQQRLTASRRAGQDRPELKSRLAKARATLKSI